MDIIICIIIIAVVAFFCTGYVKAPPDKAVIISGIGKHPKALIGKAGSRKEIEIQTQEADIAKREKEIELQSKEAEVTEKKLDAKVRKKAEVEKYAEMLEAKLYEQEKKAAAIEANLKGIIEANSKEAKTDRNITIHGPEKGQVTPD